MSIVFRPVRGAKYTRFESPDALVHVMAFTGEVRFVGPDHLWSTFCSGLSLNTDLEALDVPVTCFACLSALFAFPGGDPCQ